MSEAISVDLTAILTNPGVERALRFEATMDDGLLPYAEGKFDGKVRFDGYCFYNGFSVEIYGKVYLAATGLCDRCGTFAKADFAFDFDCEFVKRAEEPDDYIFSGSKLDLTQALTECVVLSLPTRLLCKDDCKGVCQICGGNLNDGKCTCKN